MESLPLREYELVRATDPDEIREMTERMFAPHRLILTGRQMRLDARLHCCRLIDTAIGFVAYGGEVRIEAEPTDTYFTVGLAHAGGMDVRCRGARFEISPSTGMVVSPSDDDLAAFWRHGAVQLICRIEQPALEAHLAGLLGECLSEPLRFDPVMRLNRHGGQRIVDRLRAVAGDLDRQDRATGHPGMVRAFEYSLMSDLLLRQSHNYSTALRADVKLVGSGQVRRAIALMESHPESPLTVASVATVLSISGRSLQRAFHRDMGATFRGALHDIRLRRVHDDLLRASPGMAAVNEVIVRWGLPLEGYTFVAYRRRYHETPAETLHRLT